MKRKKIGTEIKQVTVATRITLPMLEKLNKYLTTNAHVSTADYLRDLIRKDLREKGYKLYKDENHESTSVEKTGANKGESKESPSRR